MSPTLGIDSSIILTHPAVNSGAAYGFLLKDDIPGVSIQRETSSNGVVQIRIFFTVLLADNAKNPNGSKHTPSKAQDYARMIDYLTRPSGITLTCAIGVFSDVGAIGLCATEIHYPACSEIVVQLSNAGIYYPPADPAYYDASQWDGTLTWDTSYWRS